MSLEAKRGTQRGAAEGNVLEELAVLLLIVEMAPKSARSVTQSLSWQEVLPTDAVRSTAQRLLRVHALRVADSLQLAAAVVAAEHDPVSLPLVSLDERLCDAAAREGFAIVRA